MRPGTPQSRLRDFLAASLESGTPQETTALMACTADGQTDRYLTLASFRVLGATSYRDSADAAAQVVTIAEEEGNPHAAGRYSTSVRVKVDTLHWLMLRDTVNGLWGVCGYSKEGFGFGHYGIDSNTDWRPKKNSWAHLHTLADSIHHALQ